jgi:hypothetical protein
MFQLSTGKAGGAVQHHEVVNLQTWQVTLGSDTLKAVDKDIVLHPERDFETVLGNATAQCAVKEKAENCTKLAVVGRNDAFYELAVWAKDKGTRNLAPWLDLREYSLHDLEEHEEWIGTLFEKFLEIDKKNLTKIRWKMAEKIPENAASTIIAGYLQVDDKSPPHPKGMRPFPPHRVNRHVQRRPPRPPRDPHAHLVHRCAPVSRRQPTNDGHLHDREAQEPLGAYSETRGGCLGEP